MSEDTNRDFNVSREPHVMAECPRCGKQSGLSGVDGGLCLSCSASKPQNQPDMCMVFDDRGNAYAAFEYTPEELECQAQILRGYVIIQPSPFVISSSAETDEAF